MILSSCKACKARNISLGAASCPKCGVSDPTYINELTPYVRFMEKPQDGIGGAFAWALIIAAVIEVTLQNDILALAVFIIPVGYVIHLFSSTANAKTKIFLLLPQVVGLFNTNGAYKKEELMNALLAATGEPGVENRNLEIMHFIDSLYH